MCKNLTRNLQKMDDISTFGADNELDWFTNFEFENIQFASVNNLDEQCSDKLVIKRRGRQQSKHNKKNPD